MATTQFFFLRKGNNTLDGEILPICVPKLDPTAVLSNYTNSQYAKYLNDSNYTGAEIGSEKNWMVVVLSTNTSTGSFFGAASLIANMSVSNYLAALFFGLLVISVSLNALGACHLYKLAVYLRNARENLIL